MMFSHIIQHVCHSKENNRDYDNKLKSNHTCIIVPSGGKNKQHGIEQYSALVGKNYYKNTQTMIHAEINSLHKCNRKNTERIKKKNKKKMTMFVIKTSRCLDEIGNSKICKHCLQQLAHTHRSSIKITKVYYTTSQGDFFKTTLQKMMYDDIFISSKNRGTYKDRW